MGDDVNPYPYSDRMLPSSYVNGLNDVDKHILSLLLPTMDEHGDVMIRRVRYSGRLDLRLWSKRASERQLVITGMMVHERRLQETVIPTTKDYAKKRDYDE